jgi:hypothetical protein
MPGKIGSVILVQERDMKLDLRKIYRFEPVTHAAGEVLPTGGDVYYECVECGFIVSSVTHIATACDCGNLSGKQGAVDVKSPEKVRPVRGKLR